MLRRTTLAVILAASLGTPLAAQRAAGDSSLLTVDRIFASPEFRGGTFGPLAWLSDGVGYTTLERSTGSRVGRDIVRYPARVALRRRRLYDARALHGQPGRA